MKYEWRKQEKELNFPKGVQEVTVPEQKYIVVNGIGNPNETDFQTHIHALYPIVYAIRMKLKKLGFEYTVYPLEGVWTTSDGSRDENLNKDALVYRIMIRQPDQVTEADFSESMAQVLAKKENPYFQDVEFVTFAEGLIVQAIHIGPFDTEGETFAEIQQFLEEHGLHKTTTMGDYQHREIYLSDFRRAAPEKVKTLLRYRVTKD